MQTKQTILKDGFSLLEVAVVVIIIGIVLIPLTALYKNLIAGDQLDTTRDHLAKMANLVSSSFDAFALTAPDKHYPCPSDRALAPGAPGYLRQFNGGNCTLLDLKTAGLDYTLVTATTPRCTANFGFCLVQGTLDKDNIPGPDPVLIGGIPTRDMNPVIKDAGGTTYPESYSLDGWGNQFTFAVSQNLVINGPYNINTNGVIAVVDEYNNPTAGITDDAHYVLVSHGFDGKGSYSATGSIAVACGSVLTSRDANNCNNDSKFMSSLSSYKGNSADYFDDVVYAEKRIDSGIWNSIYDSAGGNTGSIHNLNKNYVGVGTATPDVKLSVSGDIKADYNVLATKVCKNDGTVGGSDCFDIKAITGTNIISCPPVANPATKTAAEPTKTIMVGITQSVADCIAPPATAAMAIPSYPCDPGQFITGIYPVTGEPICIP